MATARAIIHLSTPKQIPVLFFWTGTHEDYHKPSDTADKINYEDEARMLNIVAKIVSRH